MGVKVTTIAFPQVKPGPTAPNLQYLILLQESDHQYPARPGTSADSCTFRGYADPGNLALPRRDYWDPEQAPPTGLAVTNVANNSYRFGWGAVSGAVRYEVLVTDNNDVPLAGYNLAQTTDTYLDVTGLAASTTYKNYVRVVTSNDISVKTLSTSAFTSSTPVVTQEERYAVKPAAIFYELNSLTGATTTPNTGSLGGNADVGAGVIWEKTGMWTQKTKKSLRIQNASTAWVWQAFAADAAAVTNRWTLVFTLNKHVATAGRTILAIAKVGDTAPRINITAASDGSGKMNVFIRNNANLASNMNSDTVLFTGNTSTNPSVFVSLNAEPSALFAGKLQVTWNIWGPGGLIETKFLDNWNADMSLDKIAVGGFPNDTAGASGASEQFVQDVGFYIGANALTGAQIADIYSAGTLLNSNPA